MTGSRDDNTAPALGRDYVAELQGARGRCRVRRGAGARPRLRRPVADRPSRAGPVDRPRNDRVSLAAANQHERADERGYAAREAGRSAPVHPVSGKPPPRFGRLGTRRSRRPVAPALALRRDLRVPETSTWAWRPTAAGRLPATGRPSQCRGSRATGISRKTTGRSRQKEAHAVRGCRASRAPAATLPRRPPVASTGASRTSR